MGRMLNNSKSLCILFLALSVITSCSTVPDREETQEPGVIQVSSPIPTQVPIALTTTKTPAPTLFPTITPTLPPQITSGKNNEFSWIEIIHPSTSGGIETVVWQEEGGGFYFAVPTDRGSDEYKWYEYNLVTGDISETIEVIPRYRSSLSSWEFQGDLRSPSLRYQFETNVLNPGITPFPAGLEPFQYEHWIVDTLTGKRTIVVEIIIRRIFSTHWTVDENRVLMGFGGEGIAEYIIADVNGQTKYANGATSISPDGNWYTSRDILSGTQDLFLVNYQSGESIYVSDEAHDISWSLDSNTIFFWEIFSGSSLFGYDIENGEKYEVVNAGKLLSAGIDSRLYKISPDNQMAVFWGFERMWLVTFNNIEIND
ncbi:MAG: hypothetical protein DWQ07_03100 [Chloroflexi bacterium]|nr:MAG: hypothetical protein DWQ07_03100 [Chloroflexota bacterium]MBL1193512.1 hypothetical protein [Chloroflexota bacterium]NOH10803.1 hypothetical protein [Chloroflexota bacterium]